MDELKSFNKLSDLTFKEFAQWVTLYAHYASEKNEEFKRKVFENGEFPLSIHFDCKWNFTKEDIYDFHKKYIEVHGQIKKAFPIDIYKLVKENIMHIIILIGGMMVLVGINHFVFKDAPDNPAEQLEEALIEKETGINIDLSPEK